jgi:hypothetical protein
MAQRPERNHFGIHLAIMLALVLGNAWLQIALSDLIADFDGLGWDGRTYAALARDLPGELRQTKLEERLQRILPSAVVWQSFRMLGIEPIENRDIIQAFRLLNAVCLAGCVIVWHFIGNGLQLGRAGRWFGFIALFVNFAFAKWTFFYPVLTDAPMYLVGFLLCLTFLRRSLLGMALVTLVGSFVSSTLNVWSLPLFFFLGSAPPRASGPQWDWHVRRLTGSLVELCIAGTLISYFGLGYRPFQTQTVFMLLPSNLLGCAVYLWWGYQPLVAWEPFVHPWRLWRSMSARGVVAWLTVNLLTKVICEWIQPGSSSATTKTVFEYVLVGGYSILVRAVVAPLIFLVTHVMFFGPVVLVLLLRWRSVCRRLGEQGPGLLLFTGLLVLLALDSESRHFYVAIPFLFAFAAKEIEELRPGPAFWGIFAGFSVLWSTVWLALRNIWMWLNGQPETVSAAFYAMYLNIGPWFTLDAYYLHGQIAVIAVVALVWSLRRLPIQRLPPSGFHVHGTRPHDPLAAATGDAKA